MSHLLFPALCAGTFGLGSWQAQRYQEKVDLGDPPPPISSLPPAPRPDHPQPTPHPTPTQPNPNPTPTQPPTAVDRQDARVAAIKLALRDPETLDLAPVPSSADPRLLSVRTLSGCFDHEREVLLGPRGPPPGALADSGPNSGRSGGGLGSSPQGYFVITPLLTDSNEEVLVNRGWTARGSDRR
jgi:hypothetical protein